MYKTIEEYILNIGYDLRDVDLTNVDMTRVNLTNVILPDDPELFQKIKHKSLFKTVLPESDYSNYNFEGVKLSAAEFTKNTILPKTSDLFQVIHKKELFETKLPIINISDYNFEGVRVSKTVFAKSAIKDGNKVSFPKDFFQVIYDKNIYGTVLPELDYSDCDFTDVCIICADFGEKSTLPEDISFFQNVYDKSCISTVLPMSTIENLDLYDLTDVEIDLSLYNINTLTLYKIHSLYGENHLITFPKINIKSRVKKELLIN